MRKPKGAEKIGFARGEKAAATNTYDESESERGGTTARRDQKTEQGPWCKGAKQGRDGPQRGATARSEGELRATSSTNYALVSDRAKRERESAVPKPRRFNDIRSPFTLVNGWRGRGWRQEEEERKERRKLAGAGPLEG